MDILKLQKISYKIKIKNKYIFIEYITEFVCECVLRIRIFCKSIYKLQSYFFHYNLSYTRYTAYRTLDLCIHVTVYTDPYPVPHETTNTVYH